LPLQAVLDRAGVKRAATEFVFFGADHAEEEVEWRTQKFSVDQSFGRSISRVQALSPGPFLAYALNGEPLTRHQGSPLRLIMPGWYGVANVKWLSRIHLQDSQYLGKFQARWYRTLKGDMVDEHMQWTETAVTRMQLKSFITRVTTDGARHLVSGVVLNDGTPIKAIEVRVDDGPWHTATMDPATRGRFSWKLFTWPWTDAAPGTHTLVSRVTDAAGHVQPTAEELATKKTFLEDNAQYPRTVRIA
jgi:DMSO/TMAO reductase YedYZ molybdopterin-dependent catalytic subunit